MMYNYKWMIKENLLHTLAHGQDIFLTSTYFRDINTPVCASLGKRTSTTSRYMGHHKTRKKRGMTSVPYGESDLSLQVDEEKNT